MKKITIQLWTAVGLSVAGILLLVAGFAVAPRGQIHDSVLVAYGEISTFVGALFGVDYSYRKHKINIQRKDDNSENTPKDEANQ